MALIVENGTGVASAASYISVANADTYFNERTHLALYTTWDAVASDALKEGMLREASAYVDATYGKHYLGSRRGHIQGLLWPRTGAKDDEGYPLPDLPVILQNAVCELAARAASSPLASDLARGGQVKTQRVEGAVSVTYFDGAQAETSYGMVMGMLEPLLDGTQKGSPNWNWS